VEGVDDVVEAEAHSDVTECLIVNHTVVPGGAGVEELPCGGRDLFRRALQMTAMALEYGSARSSRRIRSPGAVPALSRASPSANLNEAVFRPNRIIARHRFSVVGSTLRKPFMLERTCRRHC
jgi:hypothetical protein